MGSTIARDVENHLEEQKRKKQELIAKNLKH
jgi:hypothetical protein